MLLIIQLQQYFKIVAGDIMEQTDAGNEKSSPKPDDEIASGDMTSSSNPQVETAPDESQSNENGLQSASPKPNVDGPEGEPGLANEDAANLNGTGNEQNSASPAQMNVTENGNVCIQVFSTHINI